MKNIKLILISLVAIGFVFAEDEISHAWNDYDFGAIFGVKIKENLGVFAEGRYLYYWERPAYDFKFGLNYQFVGF